MKRLLLLGCILATPILHGAELCGDVWKLTMERYVTMRDGVSAYSEANITVYLTVDGKSVVLKTKDTPLYDELLSSARTSGFLVTERGGGQGFFFVNGAKPFGHCFEIPQSAQRVEHYQF